MVREETRRAIVAWKRAFVLAILLNSSCSSATPVLDADVETEAGPEAEYHGELFLDETDDPNLMDLLFIFFQTRRGQEIAERCERRNDVALGECRVVTPVNYPLDECGADCTICGFTEDCGGGQCSTGDSTLLAEAGDVTIAGGTAPEYTCTEEPGTFDYRCDVASASAFSPGDVLEITASGGSFPSFQMTTEVRPRPHITSDTDSWTTTLFDGSADVQVEWTPSDSESRIELVLSTGRNERLYCATNDDGRFDIPASSIAEVSGTLVSEVRFMMTRISETTIRPTAESVFTARLISSIQIDMTH